MEYVMGGKNKKYLCIYMILSLTLTGCSFFGENNTDDTQKTLSSIAKDGISNIEAPKGCEIVSDMESFQPVTEEQSYNSKTDMNPSIVTAHGMADIGDVLYSDFENYLVYFNKKTGKYGLLCGKPDCEHIDSDICNSVLNFLASGIQYYNGDLYVVNVEKYNLVKVSSDGAERENVVSLLSKDGNYGNMTIEWFIHRGYIYYSYILDAGMTEDTFYLNNSNCLYRKALNEDSSPECIMALPMMSKWGYYSWCGVGSYIYITTPPDEENGGQLYRYNTENRKLEWFKELGANISGCAVRDNKVYYVQNSQNSSTCKMYVYDTITKEKNELCEADNVSSRMYYDDDYIYMLYYGGGNEVHIGIWNWNGIHIADIKKEMTETEKGTELMVLAGADEANIYLYVRIIAKSQEDNPFEIPSTAYGVIRYIEKEDLLDGVYTIKEWSELGV